MEEYVEILKGFAMRIEKNSQTAEIHKYRSKTLALRVKTISETIASTPNALNANNSKVKSCLVMLTATFEEISEYFKLLQIKDNALGKRVKKHGSDVEMFIKWTETLQTCWGDLPFGNIEGLFDAEIDEQDFNQDMEELKLNLKSILERVLDIFGSVELAVTANQKLLEQQFAERSQYKTLKAVKDEKTFDPKLIRYETVIGRGGFGEVWRARYRGDYLAIKKVPSNALSDEAKFCLQQEADFMKKLSHPRIVTCFGIIESEGNYCMVMELCVNGSLSVYMLNNQEPDVSIEKRIDFGIDIATGMNYLHKLGVIHRDLKLGNVVLDENDRAKITDFGLSVIKSNSQTSIKMAETGTPQYMAPESFGLVPLFSTKSDVYAFAIVMWELSHWKPAYRHVSAQEIKDSIKKGDRLPISSDVLLNIKSLIKDCWSSNPRSRPTFAIILDRLRNLSPKSTLIKSKSRSTVCGKEDLMVPSFAPRKPDISKRLLIVAVVFFALVIIGGGIGIYLVLTMSKNVAEISGSSTTNSMLLSQRIDFETIRNAARTESTFVSASVSSQIGSNSSNNTLQNFDFQSTSNTSWAEPSSPTVVSDTSLPQISSCSGSGTSHSTDFQTIDNSVLTGSTMVSATSSSQIGSSTGSGSSQSTDFQTLSNTLRAASSSSTAVSATSLSQIGSTSGTRTVSTSSNSPSPSNPCSSGYYDSGNDGCKLPGWVSTIAGNISGYNDGQGVKASFNKVYGLVRDSNGNFFVSEYGNHRIRKINATGYVSTFAGSGVIGSGDGQGLSASFNSPEGIELDSIGNLYVSDYRNHRIRKINSTGYVTTVAGNYSGFADGQGRSALLYSPDGLSFWLNGNLFFAENDNHRIRVMNSSGYVSTFAGMVQGFKDGQGTTASFNSPAGVDLDSNGNLFVADFGNHLIRKVNATGYVSTIAGSVQGSKDGQGLSASFFNPAGIIVDPNGNLYVSEYGNERIRKINSTGYVSTIAGNFSGYADGQGKAALLRLPNGLALDSVGNLYVADYFNHRIRKILRADLV